MSDFDFNKMTEDFSKLVNDAGKSLADSGKKAVDLMSKSTSGMTDQLKKEKKKMDLRSRIGEHTRALNKAYTRLGEAYYDAQATGRQVEGMQDVIDLIKSNRQVVELLNEKLEVLEKSDAPKAEEKPAEEKKED